MDATDFSPRMPGQLVPTIEGAVAFLPSPAPRVLSLPPEGQVLLSEADHQLGCLSGATPVGLNPYLVGSPLLRREAIVSSRIEGTYTTPKQLVLLEAGQAVPNASEERVNDTREVVNYIRAMEAGIEMLDKLPL